MDEGAARDWLLAHAVSRETLDRIEIFLRLLEEENARHNLVARSTLEHAWARHVVDSAQLLPLAPPRGDWADLGTGAGFPGLIVALLRPQPTFLIEQRPLRAAFLERAVELLALGDRTSVVCANARNLSLGPYAVISARAFAPLDSLFAAASHLSDPKTRWILPKGRNAKTELDAARRSWQGEFRLEPSLTDPEAMIIIAEQVAPRGKGKRER